MGKEQLCGHRVALYLIAFTRNYENRAGTKFVLNKTYLPN